MVNSEAHLSLLTGHFTQIDFHQKCGCQSPKVIFHLKNDEVMVPLKFAQKDESFCIGTQGQVLQT